MGVREAIQKHQGVAIGIALAVIVIGAYFSFRSATTTNGGGSLTKLYFSVDDGKTYFADDVSKLAPFQHDGKEAVQAYVFRCGGETKVHYLSRYTEAGRKAQGQATHAPDGAAPIETTATLVEYKRPGEANWQTTAPMPKCPGGDYPEMVNP